MSLPVENRFVCRTCLSENGDMTCVFDAEEFGDVAARICDVITFCASVQVVEGDGLPQQVCANCVIELNRAYLFRKLCQKSDVVLRSYQGSSECQPEDMNIDENTKSKEEDVQRDTQQTLKSGDHGAVRSTEDDSDDDKGVTQSLGVAEETISNNVQQEYKCEHCSLVWRSLSSYQSHLSSEHGTAISCRSCNRSFSTKTSLDRHRCTKRHRPTMGPPPKPRREARKPIVRPHVCPTCGRTFRFPVELLHHLLTHTDEKPFECSDCRQSFARASHLKVHAQTHSVGPSEPGDSPKVGGCDETGFPHGCAVCGRRFLQERTRAEHVCFRRACEKTEHGPGKKI